MKRKIQPIGRELDCPATMDELRLLIRESEDVKFVMFVVKMHQQLIDMAKEFSEYLAGMNMLDVRVIVVNCLQIEEAAEIFGINRIPVVLAVCGGGTNEISRFDFNQSKIDYRDFINDSLQNKFTLEVMKIESLSDFTQAVATEFARKSIAILELYSEKCGNNARHDCEMEHLRRADDFLKNVLFVKVSYQSPAGELIACRLQLDKSPQICMFVNSKETESFTVQSEECFEPFILNGKHISMLKFNAFKQYQNMYELRPFLQEAIEAAIKQIKLERKNIIPEKETITPDESPSIPTEGSPSPEVQ